MLNQRIRQLRQARSMSQVDLAKRLNVTKQSVSNWENDIITRGFVYVKESEELMDELRQVAVDALDTCEQRRVRDWSSIKSEMKGALSGYKAPKCNKTKRFQLGKRQYTTLY